MRKILFLFIMLWSFAGNSQQSSPLFIHKDSLNVELTNDNVIIYTHKFKVGNTLYSLAKSFNCSVEQILELNSIVSTTEIGIGQLIQIPIKKGDIMIHAKSKNIQGIPIYYDVKKKETLFRIARVYFDQSISNLVKANQLDHNTLSPGQKLLIGYYSFTNRPKTIEKENEPIKMQFDSILMIPTDSILLDSVQLETVKDSITPAYDKGPAYWNKKQKNTGQKYVLYDLAKPNSEIELYHPVTQKTIKATVLDKIPSNTYPNNIKLILSPQVAKELGARNSRFLVEIKYQDISPIE